ncbi:hypothetical protein GCM10010277_85700 [Streptomyces longisporoflavus]|nr:hypothetical protein GCM10010277_85700 [Streptomyces longisporoflavus]
MVTKNYPPEFRADAVALYEVAAGGDDQIGPRRTVDQSGDPAELGEGCRSKPSARPRGPNQSRTARAPGPCRGPGGRPASRLVGGRDDAGLLRTAFVAQAAATDAMQTRKEN